MADPEFKYAALPNLPTELLEHIGEELGISFAALSSLIRVNKRFHTVFKRFLYDSPAKAHDPILIIGAARCGNLAALQLAHEKYGADLDRIRIYPITAKEKTQLGIKYNLSPAARWGAPLHFAAAAGHMKVVNWLLSKGVDIEAPGRLYCGCETVEENMPDHYRGFECEVISSVCQPRDLEVMVWTPLHYAICQGRTNIAHRLLNAGARPSCIVEWREFIGLHDVDMIYYKALRTHNFDAFAEGSHLTLIRKHHLSPYLALGDANGKRYAVTALHTAALRGNKSISRRLVRKMGVNINDYGHYGEVSPLGYAILSADSSMTRMFLSLGADPYALVRVSGIHPPFWEYQPTEAVEAVSIAFSLHRPEAAMALFTRGGGRKGGDWTYRERKSASFLPYVLRKWGQGSKATSPEVALQKRRAFLMLTRKIIKSYGHSSDRDYLESGFYRMCADKDFDIESLDTYLKITRLTLGSLTEEGLTLGTAALFTMIASLNRRSRCCVNGSLSRRPTGCGRDYPTLIPVMEYLLQNGASTTIDFVWGSFNDPLEEFLGLILDRVSDQGPDRDIFAKIAAEAITEIIHIVNLLASHGALDFVGRKDRDGVDLLQIYGTLVGQGKVHALDLSTRRRLRAGTIKSIPRRLRKTLKVFET